MYQVTKVMDPHIELRVCLTTKLLISSPPRVSLRQGIAVVRTHRLSLLIRARSFRKSMEAAITCQMAVSIVSLQMSAPMEAERMVRMVELTIMAVVSNSKRHI